MSGHQNTIDAINRALEREWQPDGFLGKLRDREFDASGYVRLEKLLHTVRQLDETSTGMIDRELVRLLWFVPQFVEWQVERVQEHGVDPKLIRGAASNLRELIGMILGEP